jgi:cardiolipin synthase C
MTTLSFTTVFASAFLIASVNGCGLKTATRRGPAAGAVITPVQPADASLPGTAGTNGSANQFRVFDPLFQIDKTNHISPDAVARDYPIHSSDGSQIATLPDNASRFGMRIQLIDQARISIRMQAYILTGDESGYLIANHLVSATQRGVNVRVIIDSVANYGIKNQNMYLYLHRNGIKVQGYEFLYMNFIGGIANQGSFEAVIADTNQRYHDKLLIADAEDINSARCITGGSNAANEYFGVEKETPKKMWRDQDVILRGPIVQDFAGIFDRTSQEYAAEKARLQIQDFDPLISLSTIPLGGGSGMMPNSNPVIVQRLNMMAAANYPMNWQPATIRAMHSRPRMYEDLIGPVYLDMIEQSKTSIDIVNSYLVPDAELISALNRAVLRGVKVRIVTNHAKTQDLEGLVLVGRSGYKDMMASNQIATNGGKLDLYEWAGDVILKNGEGQLHAKFAIFDQKAAIVGSFNLDPRSRHLNSETIVVFQNPAALSELNANVNQYLLPTMSLPVSQTDASRYAIEYYDLKSQLWGIFAQYL